MARVVAPGGKVVVLEITTPTKPPLSTFFSLWFDRVIPLIGKVAADSQAYSYLPSSVQRFPGPEGLGAVLRRRGARRRAVDPHRGRDHRPARRDRTPARDLRRPGRRPDRRGRRAARPGAARGRRGPPGRAGARARRGARGPRRRDDRRRRQAAAAAARPPRRGAAGRRRARRRARRRRRRARPQRDPGARRRPRRRRPASRAPDGLGVGRARHGDRGRGPAVLARVRRAGAHRLARVGADAVAGELRARRGRAAPARGRLERRR